MTLPSLIKSGGFCAIKAGNWQFEVDLSYGVKAELVVFVKRISFKNGKRIYNI